MEQEIDGAALVAIYCVYDVLCEERAEPEGKAFNLQVNLHPDSHLWS